MLRKIALAAALFIAMVSPAVAGAIFIPVFVPIEAQMPTIKGDYSNIHTVAVVSAIGQSIAVGYGGFWGASSKNVDISDWKIDDGVAATLQQLLGSRFAFKSVNFDRASIQKLPNGPLNNTSGTVKKILAAIPNDGIDAFMVVRPDLEGSAPGVQGLALENGNNLGTTMRPVVWANYEIDLIDAHSFSTIAKSYARIALHNGEKPSFAGLFTGPELLLDRNAPLADAQKEDLHLYVNKIVSASLVETIRSMGFGVSLPDTGARTLVPIPEDKKPYRSAKSVAVFSVIGDQLDLEHSGMFFAHDVYALPVPDWNLDAEVVKTITENLDPRLTVKSASADLTALRGARVLNADGKEDPAFPGLAASQDVDLYIVVVKVKQACAIGQHDCNGLGMVNWTPAMPEITDVFARYAIAVIDAHTLKWLMWRTATMPPSFSSNQPFDTVANSTWPKKPPEMTPEQISTVHTSLDKILNQSIPETMMFLGLTGKMVEAPTLGGSQRAQ